MFEYIQLLFDTVWNLFAIEYPGIGISIGAISIGALVVVVSVKVLGTILGVSFSVSSLMRGEQKGGNNRSIKVSKNRRGDTR